MWNGICLCFDTSQLLRRRVGERRSIVLSFRINSMEICRCYHRARDSVLFFTSALVHSPSKAARRRRIYWKLWHQSLFSVCAYWHKYNSSNGSSRNDDEAKRYFSQKKRNRNVCDKGRKDVFFALNYVNWWWSFFAPSRDTLSLLVILSSRSVASNSEHNWKRESVPKSFQICLLSPREEKMNTAFESSNSCCVCRRAAAELAHRLSLLRPKFSSAREFSTQGNIYSVTCLLFLSQEHQKR